MNERRFQAVATHWQVAGSWPYALLPGIGSGTMWPYGGIVRPDNLNHDEGMSSSRVLVTVPVTAGRARCAGPEDHRDLLVIRAAA